MKRVVFKSGAQTKFFEKAKQAAGGWKQVASLCMVGERTIRNWARSVHAPPLKTTIELGRRFNIHLPIIQKIEEEGDIKREAGRRGALVRMALYGNPGTSEGRRKGGLRSMARMHKISTAFHFRKRINKPALNSSLAELIGIIIGDGGITKYQIRVTLNRKTDAAYAHFVSNLFSNLFGVEAPLRLHGNKSPVINVTVSSVALVKYFNRAYGLPQGNKIRQGIDIPSQIKEKQNLLKACIRGLFDTDGCIYLDIHRNSAKVYKNLGMAFTSYSPPLLRSMMTILQNWGFRPTIGRQHHLLMRRGAEIVRYFREIGTSNPKHQKRFEQFAKECGGVPKWS